MKSIKTCKDFKFEHFLIFVSAAGRCLSNYAFALLVNVPIEITSSVVK